MRTHPARAVQVICTITSLLLTLLFAGSVSAATPTEVKNNAITFLNGHLQTVNLGGLDRTGYDPYAFSFDGEFKIQTESTAMALWYGGVDNLGLTPAQLQEIYDYFVYMDAGDGWLYSDLTLPNTREFKKYLHNAWNLAGLMVLVDAGVADSAGLIPMLRDTLEANIDVNGYMNDPDGSLTLKTKSVQSVPFLFKVALDTGDTGARDAARLAVDYYMTNCIDGSFDVSSIDAAGTKQGLLNTHEVMEFVHGLVLFHLWESDATRKATLQTNITGILNRYKASPWSYTNSFGEKYISTAGASGTVNTLAQFQIQYSLGYAAEQGWIAAGESALYLPIYDRIKITGTGVASDDNNIYYNVNPDTGAIVSANLNSYLGTYMIYAADYEYYETISGTIADGGATPIAGVSVSADNGGGGDTTNASGEYSLLVINGWSGNVTPTKNEYTFAPTSNAYANVTAATASQDYVGTFSPDLTAPTPDPMSFASVPAATSSTSIAMTATTATDAASGPVEYLFECTNDAGASSGWQASPSYEATGLSPSTLYTFNVTARDSSAAQNETVASGDASATTLTPPPITVYDFSGVSSPSSGATAEDGEIDATDATIENGTFPGRRDFGLGWNNWGEASTGEYAALVGSDDSRYQGADPGFNDNAAMLFTFYVSEDPADITDIDVSVELGRNASTDLGWVYLWNYATSSYLVLGSQSGTADQVVATTISANAGDYVEAGTGQVTIFVANEDTSDSIRVDDISVTVHSAVAGAVCGNGVVETGEQCDDGNTAAGDCCDAACQYETSGSSCDDGDACTTSDTCDGAGTCNPGSALSCDDGNACTDDSCNPATGCESTNNTVSCDDGSACTVGDVCGGGVCVGGAPLSCDDGNGCTDDSCNPATGCENTNNVASCDDGDACTTGDTCSGGVCAGGAPLSCDDGNGCTDDSCNPATGCENTNNVASCDDGDACTTGDTCSGGVCAGGAPLSCDDGNGCTDDSCNPATGCENTNNVASCDDGDACTTGDTCSGGVCAGGAPLSCDDGDVCTADTCDPGLGCQNTPTTDSDGDGVCDSADLCPGSDDNVDGDGDGAPDGCDNCVNDANADQADADADTVGDVCDNCPDNPNLFQFDQDGDGLGNPCDNCRFVANPDQSDGDSDAIGDVCDNCPVDANADQADADADTVGDVCDVCPGGDDTADADGDSLADFCDNCPADANAGQEDADADTVGDACDQCAGFDDLLDGDSDTVPDDCDNCAADANTDQADADGDAVGDVCDKCEGFDDSLDADGDTTPDDCDVCAPDGNPNLVEVTFDGILSYVPPGVPFVMSGDPFSIGIVIDTSVPNEAVSPDFAATSPGTAGAVVIVRVAGHLDRVEVDSGAAQWNANGRMATVLLSGTVMGFEVTIDSPNHTGVVPDWQPGVSTGSGEVSLYPLTEELLLFDINDVTVTPTVDPSEDGPNVDQDGLFNDCDPCIIDPDNDIDGDGICGATLDNCEYVANPGQEDADGDGVGDACEGIDFDDAYADNGFGSDPATYYQASDGLTISGTYFGVVDGVSNGDVGDFQFEGTNGPAVLGTNAGALNDPTLDFDTDQSQVVLDIGLTKQTSDAVTATAYDDGVPVDAVTLQINDTNLGKGLFDTFNLTGPLDQVVVTSAAGSDMAIDNIVAIPVPEPGLLLSLFLGAGYLAALARRRER